jgi:type II secretory pathway predicted ATPase ExeA
MTMILAAFSLKDMPFQKNLPQKRLFFNNHFKEMKSRLEFLFEHQGIGLFTGEIGAGKSTMIRSVVEGMNPQLYKVVYLHRGLGNLGDFYTQFALKLGVMPKYRKSEVATQVLNTIAELYKEQKIKTALIIDEAHLLKAEILDEIRLIHNAEMDSLDYLATAIVGQPPLKKMMAYMKFQPLAQRISVSYHLEALDRNDAYKYFQYQLKSAGGKSKIFMDNAIETVINAAKGIPRVINNISIKSMYAATQKKLTAVDQECVMTALAELGLSHG